MFLADAGIPMLFVQWPLMAYALVPVIAVEVFVFRRALRLTYKSALLGTTLGNIASTAIGFPIAWGISFAIELGMLKIFESGPRGWIDRVVGSPFLQVLLFPFGAAWLNPLQPSSYWLVACAAGILLIPTFFLSVWLERLVCRWIWRPSSRADLRRAVYSANLVSYALLFVAALIWGIYLFRTYRHS
jgi:hypothetical protein